MIACTLIPGFELRAALRKQPGLALRPAALSPVAGTEPVLGPVTAVAERLGVRPGMRLGEGLATCPELVLVEQDPAAAEQAWEEILRALEDTGFAVGPSGAGCVYFETRGVERLYGGLEAALRRALAAVGTAWDPRAGAAQRRFAALAAANVARPGQILIVSDERLRDFLAPLPLELVPMEPRRRAELHELGVKRVGQLAGLPGAAVAERLGPDGRRARGLASGRRAARRRRGESWTRVCVKACGRCVRAPARARSIRWWRSHHGHAFRKPGHCSCRGTTESAAGGCRRSSCRRNARARQPPACRAPT